MGIRRCRAIESSRHTEPDEYNVLPSVSGFSNVEVYTMTLLRPFPETEAIRTALSVEQAALDTGQAHYQGSQASTSFTTSETRILNSFGINAHYRSDRLQCPGYGCRGTCRRKPDGVGNQGSRLLNTIDFARSARSGRERAIGLLGAEKISRSKDPSFWTIAVTSEFLSLLATSLRRNRCRRKNRYFAAASEKQCSRPA
jgi:predicted Zn-dependent protease